MEYMVIQKIRFGSFVKLFLFVSTSFGILFGILLFISGLLGMNIRSSLGPLQFEGLPGALLAIFICPLTFFIFGLIIGIATFIPFKAVLKLFKGIPIQGEFELCSKNNIKKH